MGSLAYTTWCMALLMIHGGDGAFLHGPQDMLPHPFHMTYDPIHIMPGITRDLTLRCESNPKSSVKHLLTKVSMVRILKKVSLDEWALLAIQTENEASTLRNDITVSGRVTAASVDDTFLEITWPEVDEDTLGVYRCDVIGSDGDNHSDLEMTTEVELTKVDISQDALIALLLQTRYDIEALIKQNAKDIELLKGQTGLLRQDNGQSGKELSLLPSTAVAWPGGEYALLQPNTGCPVDLAFYGGNSGYVRLHTESTEDVNSNAVHNETHLSQPVVTKIGSKVFFFLRFCVVTKVFNDTPWPKGSYCIHPKDDLCPAGFTSGTIHLDTEDHQNADVWGGYAPFKRPAHIPFCCRNDTSSQTPITLPTESPFYLYRVDGHCQRVKGMDVKEEFMEIDTENFLNQHSVTGAIPDSHISTESVVRIELCYYSKK